jgi:hypothetical protein
MRSAPALLGGDVEGVEGSDTSTIGFVTTGRGALERFRLVLILADCQPTSLEPLLLLANRALEYVQKLHF